ncbi:MAG: hypothetical protein A2X45_11275 [Lentisphaerae bacterium GWF2_50_93]|nr:MAG: hypothetical protein A2X45_11275 [Lentisphaerae bacterium GWF2_50_93]
MLVLLVLLVLAAAVIATFFISSRRRRDYVRRNLFSPAELSFFKVLEQALDGKYKIFTKIRLADIIKVGGELEKSERQTAFNKIQSKHVDFVLCDPGDLSVQCVIELDDKSHEAADRIARDEFVDSALESAGIPIARFAARRQYAAEDIVKGVEEAKAQPDSKQETAGTPVCSLCGAPMVLRTANKGEHAGKPFYGCSTYPKCRNTAQYISMRDTKLMKSMLR